MAEVFNFSLERDDHLNCLVSKLNSMFEEGRFVDFALAAADGRSVKVHRVILSTFSRYFEELLEKRPENYAFVMLKNVNFEDLKAIVEYMYKGSVTVSQQQAPSFLKAALLLKVAGLSNQESSNLEVYHQQSDDIGIIQARPEKQGPSIILPEHDPEDIISTQTSTIVAEPPSQMREEEKEETVVLVEEVTREHNVFRDGYLCVNQATPPPSKIDSNGRAFVEPMDDVDESNNSNHDSENPQRIMMKDKEGEGESKLSKEGTNKEVESESAQLSSQKNKDNIVSSDEEELPYSSTTVQRNQNSKTLRNDGPLLSTTVLGITKGIQKIPEQLGEDWMDTSDEENDQGNDKDVLSKEADPPPILNVECYAQSFDTSDLQDASSSTVQKPKEGENAQSIMMKDHEDAKGGDESELDQISSDDEEDIPCSSSITSWNHKKRKNDALLFPSTITQETVNRVSMQIPEEFGEDWMDTSDDGNALDNDNDLLSKAMRLSFIQNVDCNAHPSDASSATLQKKKEKKPARPREAKNKGKFRSSIVGQDPVTQFKCSDCDGVYSRRSSLTRHLNYVCGKTLSFPCTLCNYRARTKFYLEKHLRNVHKTAPETQSTFRFKCCKYGHIFKLQRNLKIHLKKGCKMVITSTD